MDTLEILNIEYEKKKLENDPLEKELESVNKEIKVSKDKFSEVTMRRIAMQEITQCSKEGLFKSMGYIKSFHGYPDKYKPNCECDK